MNAKDWEIISTPSKKLWVKYIRTFPYENPEIITELIINKDTEEEIIKYLSSGFWGVPTIEIINIKPFKK
jgi:hypothetical protein